MIFLSYSALLCTPLISVLNSFKIIGFLKKSKFVIFNKICEQSCFNHFLGDEVDTENDVHVREVIETAVMTEIHSFKQEHLNQSSVLLDSPSKDERKEYTVKDEVILALLKQAMKLEREGLSEIREGTPEMKAVYQLADCLRMSIDFLGQNAKTSQIIKKILGLYCTLGFGTFC